MPETSLEFSFISSTEEHVYILKIVNNRIIYCGCL